MDSLDRFLEGKLRNRTEEGLLRKLTTTRAAVDFFSNDYLGLARSEELSRAIERRHRALGVHNGSTGSRLLGGNSSFTEEVEHDLSGIFKSEACLIFNSGYAANLAVLSAIPQRGDTILYDNLAHASLKDGARLSLATRHSFRHNDMVDLDQKLKSSKGRKFIAVESVYSMDGDECPMKEIVSLAGKYGATVLLDEAHSTGVTGPAGAGAAVEQGLHQDIDIRVYTFGKAMGVHGACVAGSRTLIDYLVNFSRPFIYTTALSQHEIVSVKCAFEHLAANIPLQALLKKKINLYLQGAAALSNRTDSRSAIQTIFCPGNGNAKGLATALQLSGFDVRPILYPTVAEGTERLRICLHAFNSDDEIRSLTTALHSLVA